MQSRRQLAAIMFTDVVGYTATMAQDEKLAVRMLGSHEQFLESLVAQNNGRVVQYYGDGSLSLFDSATDAATCATQLQLALRGEHEVPLRIGLHISEVLEQDGKVLGNGVNIASRIESSGYAGTILVSADFRDKVKNQTDLNFEELGQFRFKNVQEPMQLWAITGEWLPAIDPGRLTNRTSSQKVPRKRAVPYLVIAALVVAVMFAIWRFALPADSGTNEQSTAEVDLESIAVFPFTVQGRPDLAYLSEGLVDVFSTKIDGIPGYNAIDPNVIIGRLKDLDEVPESPSDFASISNSLGAGHFILGSLTVFGSDVRIKVAEYNTKSEVVADAEVVIQDIDDLLEAVDELARQTIAEKYQESRQEWTAAQVMFSKDLKAVAHFLRGENLRRSGQYREASQLYTDALNIDSTMALAWLRLWQVCTWDYVCPGSEYALTDNAIKYRTNLPPKFQEYIKASLMTRGYFGKDGRIQAFHDLIDKYGEYSEFLVGMGEAYFHAPMNDQTTVMDALPYFLKSFEIDPGNTEVVNHVAQLLGYTRDSAKVRYILERLPPDSDNWSVYSVLELAVKNQPWTDEQLRRIMSNPQFNMESVFMRVRSDKYLERFVRIYHDIIRLNNGPYVTPNVPVNSLVHFYTGTELTLVADDFELTGPGIYSAPMYNIEDDCAFRNEYFTQAFSSLIPGRTGAGIYPDDFPLALIAMSQNDEEATIRHMTSLQRVCEEKDQYWICLGMARGLLHRQNGDFEASNAVLDSVRQQYDASINRLANIFITAVAQYTMVDNFISMGDHEQALRVLEDQFIVLDGGEDRIVARSLLQRSELNFELGRYSKAAEYANEFLRLFESSSLEYRDWVVRAESIRDRASAQIN